MKKINNFKVLIYIMFIIASIKTQDTKNYHLDGFKYGKTQGEWKKETASLYSSGSCDFAQSTKQPSSIFYLDPLVCVIKYNVDKFRESVDKHLPGIQKSLDEIKDGVLEQQAKRIISHFFLCTLALISFYKIFNIVEAKILKKNSKKCLK